MINKDNLYIMTREELKNSSAEQFIDKDVVICGKYYIHIKYGDYSSPRILTDVNTREDLRNLPMSKHPHYIRDFIDRRKEELN